MQWYPAACLCKYSLTGTQPHLSASVPLMAVLTLPPAQRLKSCEGPWAPQALQSGLSQKRSVAFVLDSHYLFPHRVFSFKNVLFAVDVRLSAMWTLSAQEDLRLCWKSSTCVQVPVLTVNYFCTSAVSTARTVSLSGSRFLSAVTGTEGFPSEQLHDQFFQN